MGFYIVRPEIPIIQGFFVYPVRNNTQLLYGVGYHLGQFTRGSKIPRRDF